MLLRSVATLLRKLGHDVEIETYHCDFSAAVGEEGLAKTPAGLAPFVGETPPVHGKILDWNLRRSLDEIWRF